MCIRLGKGVQTVEAWMLAGGAGTSPEYEYPGALSAQIATPLKDVTIRCTLDGTEPSTNSPVYTPDTLNGMGQEVGTNVTFKACLFDQSGGAVAHTLVRVFHNQPFHVHVVGAVRPGDARFADELAFDLTQNTKTGLVRYQVNGPVTKFSPRFTKPMRIADNATVMFRYFDEAGNAKGPPWKMLARRADFDPYSLTYKKDVTAAFGPKEFAEWTVDGLVDRNECLGAKDVEQTVTVDLGNAVKVSRVILYTLWDERRAYQYTLGLSTDGKEWHIVADATSNAVVATPKGYSHSFDAQMARYIRATVPGNNVAKSVEITELRAYGPDQKPLSEGGVRPANRESMPAQLRADLRFIESAAWVDLKPADISGPFSNMEETFGPGFNCRLVGDVDFDWLCGKFSGTLDLNGHTINWTTGGGNSAVLHGTLTGNSGRLDSEWRILGGLGKLSLVSQRQHDQYLPRHFPPAPRHDGSEKDRGGGRPCG